MSLKLLNNRVFWVLIISFCLLISSLLIQYAITRYNYTFKNGLFSVNNAFAIDIDSIIDRSELVLCTDNNDFLRLKVKFINNDFKYCYSENSARFPLRWAQGDANGKYAIATDPASSFSGS